jgi:hypothetical protein
VTATALSLLASASAATAPTVRHTASGAWNNPEQMAALLANPLVHYERGATEYAKAVAALLRTAIAQVESVQGRPFAHPVPIGVYVSGEAFAAANGLGHPRAAGVTLFGRVLLSPILFLAQRQRLPGILTHELSHAHLQGWVSTLTYIHLPNWFKEGLAVMVSGGGGAEQVSEAEAREAIRRGRRIAVESEGSPLNLTEIKFENPPEIAATALRPVMAYRQAGLFVTFLQRRDPEGFARMMAAVLDGRPFVEAVANGYGTDLHELWSDFVRAND